MSELLSPEDYLAEVLATLTPLAATNTPLTQAHGLILAQDVVAALSVPPWTNSAMDGYAVRARDTDSAAPHAPVVLPVAADVPAGAAPAPLAPGTAQRIMTGAMLPEGADAVVKVEDTDQAPGPRPLPAEVEIRTAVAPGAHVRYAGEDLGAGDPVLASGTLLSAAAISSLASVGLGTVRAVPRPRVAVVSTGAELVDPGRALPAGAIPDSNSLLLAGLVAEHGASLASVSRSGDTAASLAAALIGAARDADLIVTSGGVSAGAFDPLTMLASEGGGGDAGAVRLHVAKVAMQPGKPQGYGTVRIEDGGASDRRVPVITLPGNPVSVLVSFTTIVAPALALLAGHSTGPGTGHDGVGRPGTGPTDRNVTTGTAAAAGGRGGGQPGRARAAVSWRTPAGRRQHVPVRFVDAPAGADERAGARTAPWVEPTHRLGSGSHLVASLPTAEALAVVDADAPAVDVGDEVGLIALTAPTMPGGGRPSLGPPASPARIAAPAPADPPTDPPRIRLPHVDDTGAALMVDVTAKTPTVRTANATAFVSCSSDIVAALREGTIPKGDVLAVARVAGIAAAKRVPELLPLAHVIGVHGCRVDLTVEEAGVRISTNVRSADRTGVEMEALTAATVAALTVIDMVKGVDRAVALREAKVTEKSGGRSGTWTRPADADGDGAPA